MNRFLRLFKKTADTVDSDLRWEQLEAGHKKFIAEQEEIIADSKLLLNNYMLKTCYEFSDIVGAYKRIIDAENAIEAAKKAYLYLFEVEDEEKETV